MVGHRYECDQCGKRIWLAAGSGAAIYSFISIWFSGMWFFIEKQPIGLVLTAVVCVALGAREAWMRRRHPKAA